MLDSISYDLVLTIHISSFIFNITLVVLSDFMGLLWVLGKKEVLPAKWMNFSHRAIWIGLIISILSGIYLFRDLQDFLLTVPAFYTKMFLVLALLINSFVIHSHLKVVTSQSFKSVGKSGKMKLLISGFVSVIGWVGVYLSAQFLGV